MTKLIPTHERSKQLQRYYRIRKLKAPGECNYNSGNPRADLSEATPFQKNLIASLYAKRSMCAKEGIPCDLDSEWALQQHPICAVTGVQLTFGPKPSPLRANIDQIIPGAGYIRNNVRIVAAWFNEAKKAYPDAQIQQLICSAADHIRTSKIIPVIP